MSANKRYKKYLWENKQLSREEWEKKISEVDFGNVDVFEKLYKTFKEKIGDEFIWPESFNEKCENSTGEYLHNCLNVENSWFSDGAKNCVWTLWGNFGTENCHLGCDPGSSDCFGNLIAVNSSRCFFSWILTRCRNCEYCIECLECENCFACVGLKHKKFYIFNKQYSEDDYWRLIDKLKCVMLDRGEYSKRFPPSLMQTPFKHSGGSMTFHWRGEEDKIGVMKYDASLDGAYGNWEGKIIRSVNELPKNIRNVGDEWIGAGFMDSVLKRPYSIHPMELELHKRLVVPIRREHFIRRIEDLWSEVNTLDIENTNCRSCSASIRSAYNRAYTGKKVFCHQCYLKYLNENG